MRGTDSLYLVPPFSLLPTPHDSRYTPLVFGGMDLDCIIIIIIGGAGLCDTDGGHQSSSWI